MSDMIVYLVVRKSAEPEKEAFAVDAFVEKAAAHARAAKDDDLEVKPIVVDIDELRSEALMRLSALERLFFKFEVPRAVVTRGSPAAPGVF